MFEIDKRNFDLFLAELRKEKGYTQRDMAEKLFISDKAVSKWETGVSIPDTALLILLADLLGVSVTELLLCERIEQTAPLETERVEAAIKTALTFSEERTVRAYRVKSRWPVFYICALISALGVTLCHYLWQFCSELLITSTILGAVFGAYFCFFVKLQLPRFYDENRCGIYYDGPFHMNVFGLTFNNGNWPHIVRVGRVWSCAFMACYPILSLSMNLFYKELWMRLELPAFLILMLGGLFLPMYAVGKYFERDRTR